MSERSYRKLREHNQELRAAVRPDVEQGRVVS